MTIPAGYLLRPMTANDHAAAHALWTTTEGMGLGESDSLCGIRRFLARNPGLSLVVHTKTADDSHCHIVGTVLAGHDGRRGYLHHLAVARDHRGRGIGRALVENALEALRREGIGRANIYLYASNDAGRAFWLHEGWRLRDDIVVMQKLLACDGGGC